MDYEEYEDDINEEKETVNIDKKKLKGKNGDYITQGLFLELSYNDPKHAIFTLAGEDKMYKGKNMISLRALYLEMEDPVGYEFANTYLYDYDHWNRMKVNKRIAKEIEKWEDELEIKLRSNAIRAINERADAGDFSAAKYIAEGKWKQRGAGRPTNEEKERHLKIVEKTEDEWSNDVLAFNKGR
jgi:hypothetical protein